MKSMDIDVDSYTQIDVLGIKMKAEIDIEQKMLEININ